MQTASANVAFAHQLSAGGASLRRSRRCQAQLQRQQQERRPLSVRVQAASGSGEQKDPWEINGRKPLIARAPEVSRRGMMAGAVAAVCACCADLGISQPAQASGWGYGNPEGIAQWPKVAPLCASGTIQSPIDIIPTMADGALGAGTPMNGSIKFNYVGSPCTVVNTGHGTMQARTRQKPVEESPAFLLEQVNFDSALTLGTVGDKQSMEVNGRKYKLLQFHFHSPSEHAMDGRHSAMEVHLVHKDIESGGLAVIGTFLNVYNSTGDAGANPALEAALTKAPSARDAPEKVSFLSDCNPMMLLPPASKRNYYQYMGSLTTPPCAEQVQWRVFEAPIEVSASQVLRFMRYVGAGDGSLGLNARPPQPINARSLTRVVANPRATGFMSL